MNKQRRTIISVWKLIRKLEKGRYKNFSVETRTPETYFLFQKFILHSVRVSNIPNTVSSLIMYLNSFVIVFFHPPLNDFTRTLCHVANGHCGNCAKTRAVKNKTLRCVTALPDILCLKRCWWQLWSLMCTS